MKEIGEKICQINTEIRVWLSLCWLNSLKWCVYVRHCDEKIRIVAFSFLNKQSGCSWQHAQAIIEPWQQEREYSPLFVSFRCSNLALLLWQEVERYLWSWHQHSLTEHILCSQRNFFAILQKLVSSYFLVLKRYFCGFK